MRNRTQVFIIDDSLPKLEEFIEKRIYEKAIKKDDLLFLANKGNWSGEGSLRQLIMDLLDHDYVKTDRIEVLAYNHPEICLSELSNNRPEVVIYDWEYGDPFTQSSDWLLDILRKTEAFIFVYSATRDSVPPYLNKKQFDEFANRFQLFAKGNSTNSVFTSEDFLYQYILSLISNSNVIKIQGIDVKFETNGYLKEPADILYLESILGRAALLERIQQNHNEISEESVERMLGSLDGHMLLNGEKGVLIAADSSLLVDKFRPSVEISYLEALRTFGLIKLKEAIEIGFARL